MATHATPDSQVTPRCRSATIAIALDPVAWVTQLGSPYVFVRGDPAPPAPAPRGAPLLGWAAPAPPCRRGRRRHLVGVVTSTASSPRRLHRSPSTLGAVVLGPANPRSRRLRFLSSSAGEPPELSPSYRPRFPSSSASSSTELAASEPVVLGVALDRGRSPRPAEADGIPGHPPRNRASRVVPSGCASESARPPLAVLLTWGFRRQRRRPSPPSAALRRPRRLGRLAATPR